MADVINPVTFLGDMADLYGGAAQEQGIAAMDPVLCQILAEGFREAAATMEALLALCGAHDLIERYSVPLDVPDSIPLHTPSSLAERSKLACSAHSTAEGNVVPFPQADRARSTLSGGSAA